MNLQAIRRPTLSAGVLRAPAVGFVALLLALFAVAWATGSQLGPVAPGMHPGAGNPATVGEGGGHGHGAGR
ncbi:hypothetical protein HUT13_09670 [Streptomyces harbinensis]|uniref:hypothetical protein n=1 Tax=Streptomyces harbinensis TaxID=1176198 RepID=UPI0015907A78|nr:hypothetical protein [Streptomyces harbinensis]QKV69022.1 hypothetical protein HUT13_09670 [Streptomyces harbinensis]